MAVAGADAANHGAFGSFYAQCQQTIGVSPAAAVPAGPTQNQNNWAGPGENLTIISLDSPLDQPAEAAGSWALGAGSPADSAAPSSRLELGDTEINADCAAVAAGPGAQTHGGWGRRGGGTAGGRRHGAPGQSHGAREGQSVYGEGQSTYFRDGTSTGTTVDVAGSGKGKSKSKRSGKGQGRGKSGHRPPLAPILAAGGERHRGTALRGSRPAAKPKGRRQLLLTGKPPSDVYEAARELLLRIKIVRRYRGAQRSLERWAATRFDFAGSEPLDPMLEVPWERATLIQQSAGGRAACTLSAWARGRVARR
eukprot:SAG22_NODE_245_length_13962_cov_11.954555_14_plen_309_part_00